MRTPTGVEPSTELRRLVDGFQISQALHVLAVLGIADLLAAGPRSSAKLAEAVGAHERSLYRVLRVLASVGVLRESDAQTFALTPVGDCLRSDAPSPVGGWAAFIGTPGQWQAWAALLHTVRSGETAFDSVHGETGWEYRARNPDEGAIFDRAMTDLSRRASRRTLDAFDFGHFATVVDVGGGHGAFLGSLLARYPGANGVLFDQPRVVALAASVLAEAGVADRCRIEGGSFFETIPSGGDAYVLKSVLHDWPDVESTSILRVCRANMPVRATLVVVERVLGPSNEDRDGSTSDLQMLVGNGGQERTLEEYTALLAASGFRILSVAPGGGGLSVLEARPS
jgi:O-methyltransferase domain/Dimerisation domain